MTCDIYRVRYPFSKRYTWRQKTPLKQRRLDYFLISDQLQEQIQTIEIIPPVQSDRSTLIMKIGSIRQEAKGKSYWKFTTSLVYDKSFVELMKSEIVKYDMKLSEFNDPRIRWDYLKYRMRQFAPRYSIDKARGRRGKRQALEQKVKELESLISTGAEECSLQEYNKCKQDFEEIYNYITEGIILRSKTDWYELGEKSTKYFLNLEKRNKAKSHIRVILTESSSEITDSKAILSELKSFYSNLYEQRSTETKADCLHCISNFSVPKLNVKDRTICEGKLSKKECYDALLSLGNNKNPGNDGLSKEFYVCFFNEIHSFLIQALNYSFQHGELSISQRQAVITLTEKKRKDKRCIKKWRPISLMNVDTKIASKAIALRLKKVIPKLIQCDQTAYVNNHYTGEANRLIVIC